MLKNLNKSILQSLKRSQLSTKLLVQPQRSFRASSLLCNAQSTQQSEADAMEQATLGSIKRPRKSDVKYMADGGMPIDGNGVLALPKQPERNLVDEFYEKRGFEHELVQEILTDKFFDIIQAMCQGDEDKIRALAEKRFANQIIKNLPKIKSSQISFDKGSGKVSDLVKENNTDFGILRKNLISDINESYIVDSMIVKGVSANREENDCNYDYNKIRKMENQGMMFYMHKYFSGHMHYYLQNRYQKHVDRLQEISELKNKRYADALSAGHLEEDKKWTAQLIDPSKFEQGEIDFGGIVKKETKQIEDQEEPSKEKLMAQLPIDEDFELIDLQQNMRDITFQLRKEMNDLTMRMMLRVTICFKDIGLFKTKNSQDYGDNYTGNHIAIFECEMKAPPQMAFIDHTYNEYINAYRINFRNWKVVDIDNFMNGNHFFSELQEESVWNKKVSDMTGGGSTGMWREKEYSPLFDREIMIPELQKAVDHIDLLDTKSNRQMSPLHKKKQEILQMIENGKKTEEAAKQEKPKKQKKEKKAAAAGEEVKEGEEKK